MFPCVISWLVFPFATPFHSCRRGGRFKTYRSSDSTDIQKRVQWCHCPFVTIVISGPGHSPRRRVPCGVRLDTLRSSIDISASAFPAHKKCWVSPTFLFPQVCCLSCSFTRDQSCPICTSCETPRRLHVSKTGPRLALGANRGKRGAS